MNHYAPLEYTDPPAAVEIHVMAAVRYAVKRLAIRRPVKYSFFVPGSETWHDPKLLSEVDVGGLVFAFEPDRIWVRADIEPGEAAEVALHECCHVAQLLAAGERDPDADEMEAVRFASRHLPLLAKELR